MDYIVNGSGTVRLGQKCRIGSNVQFIVNEPSEIIIGDNVILGDNVKVVVESGNVNIDDWSSLHANTLVLCKKEVNIGQHCWFGQNTVLDGTGGLNIKNGVRVGMYSQIWTHVAAGEQIEGCTLIGENPVTIDRDAWLVGSCTVGSGVTIGKKAICMNGSNITKNVADDSVVMGIPAKPRSTLNFYKTISLDDKFKLMITWVHEFSSLHNNVSVEKNNTVIKVSNSKQNVLIFKECIDYSAYVTEELESKFCLETKEYTKNLLDLEIDLIRYLSGNKARFYTNLSL